MINLPDRQNEDSLAMVNQMKIELLEDDPDNDLLHNVWKQSFSIRRLCIRELRINEILEHFPGYCRAEMVSIIDHISINIFSKLRYKDLFCLKWRLISWFVN